MTDNELYATAYQEGTRQELGLQDMIESLYNLDRWELRRLAAEALLISDGPDMPEEMKTEDPGSAVAVTTFSHRYNENAKRTVASFAVDIWDNHVKITRTTHIEEKRSEW